MLEKIEELTAQGLAQLREADAKELEQLRVEYIGKKGHITSLMKSMGSLDPSERPAFGQRVNKARADFEAALAERQAELKRLEREQRLVSERIDVTLPSKRTPVGGTHPLMKVYAEIRDIFVNMGFEVVDGPEVELDMFNFELLNIPKNHPSRDIQDTIYVSDDVVLRTHTSPVQVRTMLRREPPIRMICPGRVYRMDDVDATHSPVFYQMEGMVIDKNITFANLKSTIDTFLKEFYGEKTRTKFRPGFFPFTEPSAEVDATCSLCGGKGCPACKGEGMIEVLGCGMVNPIVLKNCGVDPDVYSGFAFGLGLDRLTNIKYGVTDIRLLYENDVRFLSQFR